MYPLHQNKFQGRMSKPDAIRHIETIQFDIKFRNLNEIPRAGRRDA